MDGLYRAIVSTTIADAPAQGQNSISLKHSMIQFHNKVQMVILSFDLTFGRETIVRTECWIRRIGAHYRTSIVIGN
jgi:hypothetical protein